MISLLQSHSSLWVGTVFAFSLLIGSFLNVVILRLPRRMEYEWQQQLKDYADPDGEQGTLDLEPPPDLVFTRSHCPKCGHGITAFENIPVFSYLALRGRCRGCGTRISVQYPLVEGITALLSAFVAAHFGMSWEGGAALILTWSLVALTVIDLREQLLPDAITLPLLWLGLLLNANGMFTAPTDAVIGAAAGYLSLWSVYHVFRLLTGKEGMGYGDFKLLAVFGAWLGWQFLPLVILFSSFVGATVGIAMVVVRGRDRNLPMPFGPYLAAAGWIAMIWGDRIIATYLGTGSLAP